jgi:hypothetical protein
MAAAATALAVEFFIMIGSPRRDGSQRTTEDNLLLKPEKTYLC